MVANVSARDAHRGVDLRVLRAPAERDADYRPLLPVILLNVLRDLLSRMQALYDTVDHSCCLTIHVWPYTPRLGAHVGRRLFLLPVVDEQMQYVFGEG